MCSTRIFKGILIIFFRNKKSILNKIEKPYNISIISSKDLAIPYTEYVLNPN